MKKAEAQGIALTPYEIPEQPARVTESSLRKLRQVTLKSLKQEQLQPVTVELPEAPTIRAPRISHEAVKAPTTPRRKGSPETVAEYQAQRKRIQGIIRRAQKRGYQVNFELEASPAVITKSDVERLQSVKPANIYLQSTYNDMNGAERRRQERQEAYRRGMERVQRETPPKPPEYTDEVLANIEDEINNWTPMPQWSEYFAKLKRQDMGVLARALQGVINRLGRDQVARNAYIGNEKYPEYIQRHVLTVLYDSDRTQVQNSLKALLEILEAEDMTIEQAKETSEQQEEDWANDGEIDEWLEGLV